MRLYFLLWTWISISAFAQSNLDSLSSAWQNRNNTDSLRLDALNELASRLLQINPDSALTMSKLEVEQAKKLKNTWGQANAYRNLGNAYYFTGSFVQALENYQKSYRCFLQFENTPGLHGQAIALNSVGMIYSVLGNTNEAIRASRKAEKIAEFTSDSVLLSRIYNSLGIYYETFDLDSSLFYYKKSLELKTLFGDWDGRGNTLANIGSVYERKGNLDQAIVYRENARTIFEERADVRKLAGIYGFLGVNYVRTGRIDEAIEICLEGYELSQMINSPGFKTPNCQCLYMAYAEKGDFETAYKYLLEAGELRDSTSSQDAQSRMLNLKYQFEYENKAKLDSVKTAEAEAMHELDMERERAVSENLRTQRYALYIGIAVVIFILLLITAILVLIINRLRYIRLQKGVIERQKDEVELQKALIEEKNVEITASIHYAQRIQEALLPAEGFINEFVRDNFIFYMPKDIVAGDFYWIDKQENSIYFAVADCTGHGVPGAMVSVVCHNALNRCTREFKLQHPDEILNKCRDIVIDSFQSKKHDVKDGMDIALCRLDLDTKQLEYAGANNDILHVSGDAIRTVPSDRQPIGKYRDSKPFTNHKMQLASGDLIFLYSDGFADQFGGSKGKKFKYEHFQKLLFSNREKPMALQCQQIEDAFNSWKGPLEQIDDVCVLGFRV